MYAQYENKLPLIQGLQNQCDSSILHGIWSDQVWWRSHVRHCKCLEIKWGH